MHDIGLNVFVSWIVKACRVPNYHAKLLDIIQADAVCFPEMTSCIMVINALQHPGRL